MFLNNKIFNEKNGTNLDLNKLFNVQCNKTQLNSPINSWFGSVELCCFVLNTYMNTSGLSHISS